MHDAATPAYWSQRWREGRIGWHLADANPWLLQHGAQLRGPVLVPLAGRTVDLEWLCQRHSEVIAIEAVSKPIEEWFEAYGLKAEKSPRGPYIEHRAEGHPLRFLEGDVFALEQAALPDLGAVWDRAALFALPKPERARYSELLSGLISQEAELLLVTLEYDQDRVDGPPFSVPHSELEEHFSSFSIEALGTEDVTEKSTKHREAGCPTVLERAWRIRA